MDKDTVSQAVRALAPFINSVDDVPDLLIALADVEYEQWSEMILTMKGYTSFLNRRHWCDLCGASILFFKDKDGSICRDCLALHKAERRIVDFNCSRARQVDLPATLTLVQWLSTLKHFSGLCAYCQRNKGTMLEHFVPITLGGGTTVSNCVPSCHTCNIRKKNKHPNEARLIPQEDRDRVKQFLSELEITL